MHSHRVFADQVNEKFHNRKKDFQGNAHHLQNNN